MRELSAMIRRQGASGGGGADSDTLFGEDRRTRAVFFEDFIYDHSTSSIRTFLEQTSSGGTVNTNITNRDKDHLGILRISSGGGTGITTVYNGSTSGGVLAVRGWVVLEATNAATFETLIKIANLSDVTDNYVLRCGLMNQAASTGFDVATDGVFFEYDSDASANWRTYTRNASTDTVNTSATVVSTNWTRLTLTATTSSVTFAVNGSTVATHSTNIPTAAGLFKTARLHKSAGSSARVVDIDYIYFDKTISR